MFAMFRLSRCLQALLVSLLFFGLTAWAETLSSPDGRLVLLIETSASAANSQESQLVYRVTFRGKPLVDQSALRLELEGQRPLGSDVRVVKVTPSNFDETYRLLTGKASEVRNHYNALRVDLEEPSGLRRKLTIEARAYDDAVAFRYVVPEQNP